MKVTLRQVKWENVLIASVYVSYSTISKGNADITNNT